MYIRTDKQTGIHTYVHACTTHYTVLRYTTLHYTTLHHTTHCALDIAHYKPKTKHYTLHCTTY